jgi:hypothetical protein
MQKMYGEIIKKAWEDEAFKEKLIKDPRGVLKKDFNIDIPEDSELKVLLSNPKLQYLVIPSNPSEDKLSEMTEDEVLAIAAGSGIFTYNCLPTQYNGGPTCPPFCNR